MRPLYLPTRWPRCASSTERGALMWALYVVALLGTVALSHYFPWGFAA